MTKKKILEEFKSRYLKTDDGWILDGKNGAEIEQWLSQKLDQLSQDLISEIKEKVERYQFTLVQGIPSSKKQNVIPLDAFRAKLSEIEKGEV